MKRIAVFIGLKIAELSLLAILPAISFSCPAWIFSVGIKPERWSILWFLCGVLLAMYTLITGCVLFLVWMWIQAKAGKITGTTKK